MTQDLEVSILSRTLADTETLQLAEIHSFDAFYTPIEERFERITRLARRASCIPVIAITVITRETQWFKSVCGWTISEIPTADSLCAHTIEKRQPVVVSDLTKNPRYAAHKLVVNAPKFRFYAGAPLVNAKGVVIGTLCFMDVKPRKFSAADYQMLEDLAVLAQRELLTIALHNAQTALISKLSVARRQALLDPLTRTWNRRGGMKLLEEGLERAKSDKKSIAVCAIDVNDFKAVNDTFGHAAGDTALRVVARELLSSVRDNDGVCRCGGDEFFVVLVGAEPEQVRMVAERIRRRIEKTVIRQRTGEPLKVSVSTGVKFVEPGESISAEDILREADKALYENKMASQLKVDDEGILAV